MESHDEKLQSDQKLLLNNNGEKEWNNGRFGETTKNGNVYVFNGRALRHMTDYSLPNRPTECNATK